MPRSGGTYSLPAGNPVVTGTTISSTTHNNTMSDVAAALTQSVSKDGQTTMTGNLPMGGFKLTGLADGSAATDSVTLGQLQAQSGTYVGTVGGTADVITLTPTPAITAYAAGQRFSFIASGANTTNVTVNISTLGAKAITKAGATALVANDISAAGVLLTIEYDGTQFQMFDYLKTGTSGHVVPLLDGANTFSGANTWSGIQTHSAAINAAKGADVASATTTDIGAATGNFIHITGTTTITSFGTIQAGTVRFVEFTGILTLTYNGTSLVLPSAANITTAAGDTAVFISEGFGNWRCLVYNRASGRSLVNLGTDVQTYTSSNTWFKPGGYAATSRVLLQAWGAGAGGGGGGLPTAGYAATGGGGGGYAERFLLLSDLGVTETVTIGAGGAGGLNGNGTDGGNTTIGSLLTAYGGTKGLGVLLADGAGGHGGGFYSKTSGGQGATAAVGGNGDFFTGGAGGGILYNTTGYAGGSAYNGGGGGGGVADTNAGAAGPSTFGGSGGTNGSAGAQPGGGGGAVNGNSTAGAGGAGKVIITVFG